MLINPCPEVKAYILNKVNSGFYGNDSEAVREAIRSLDDEDEKLDIFCAAIEIADARIACGEAEADTLELKAELLLQAVKNARQRRKIYPV